MSNTVYPLGSDKIVNPLSVTLQFKTLKGDTFGNVGETQRKAKREYPTRLLSVKHAGLNSTNIQTLYNFYIARKGAYDDFAFIWPSTWDDRSYTDEYVGKGDGSTTTFNLPIKSGSSYTIYVDSVEQTESVDYDYTVGGGACGEDLVTFDSGSIPDDGAIISIDVTGRLKITCYFAEDNLSWEEFSDIVSNSSLKIQGVLNS